MTYAPPRVLYDPLCRGCKHVRYKLGARRPLCAKDGVPLIVVNPYYVCNEREERV